MGKNIEHAGEERKLGTLLVVYKEDWSVFVIQDESKTEKSAMVNPREWVIKDDEKPTIGFPGGGRAKNVYGLQETSRQTLDREAREEINPKFTLPLRNKHTGHRIKQQIYPLVVAQLKPNAINQIAATSFLYPFDSFNRESQKIMEDLVDQQLAHWIRLNHIFQALKDSLKNDDDPNNIKLLGEYYARPQLLAVATIWHLEQTMTSTDNALEWIIATQNRELIAEVKRDSLEKKLEIINGAFNNNGTVTELNKRDKEFILRPKSQNL